MAGPSTPPGTEPMPPAVETRRLNPGTTREPQDLTLKAAQTWSVRACRWVWGSLTLKFALWLVCGEISKNDLRGCWGPSRGRGGPRGACSGVFQQPEQRREPGKAERKTGTRRTLGAALIPKGARTSLPLCASKLFNMEVYPFEVFFFFFNFYFLALLCGLQDLSSPTRDRT